jgi:dTDP-4-amino-4,6-dideoxygalactose transaminase
MHLQWVPKKDINFDKINILLQKCIESNHFTNNGPITKLLESTIRNKLNISENKAIIPISNGTVALWVCVAAIELMIGRKCSVGTQAFTFPASAQGYLHDAKIYDIDEEGGLMLTNNLHNEVDIIIVTNIFGNVVNIQKYIDWCEKYNKYLIFDNAATGLTYYKGKNSLNYGNASTISFHHTKPLGFGEGGAVIVDLEIEQNVRDLINFGINNNSKQPKWNKLGGNYKMSDISAAYIYQHINNMDSIFSNIIELTNYFILKINDIKGVQLYPDFSDKKGLLSCIAILFESKDISYKVQEKCLENGIYVRKYYNPLIELSNSLRIFDTILCIPIHQDITKEIIDYIINLITNILT